MSVLQVVTDCTSYYENLQVKVSYQSDKTFTLFTKVDLKEEVNIVDKSLDNHFFTILSLQENNNRKYFM